MLTANGCCSGVNYWDAMFPALVQYLGLPNSTKTVPFNIINATVAYAVEDIVLGDLLYNKHVSGGHHDHDDACSATSSATSTWVAVVVVTASLS